MTRTQLKDGRRNIQKQLISFISIVVIAMIAVMAYLGIAYPAAAMRTYFENYYDRYRLWDRSPDRGRDCQAGGAAFPAIRTGV